MTGPTDGLVGRVVSGGYPEALSRAVPARRRRWLRSYARALAERDVTEIASVTKLDEIQVEVDFVLERFPGDVVGIEVKASATVNPRDFRGLVRLQQAAGDGFACGIVLHDGDRVQQTASRLFAMPVKMLWEA